MINTFIWQIWFVDYGWCCLIIYMRTSWFWFRSMLQVSKPFVGSLYISVYKFSFDLAIYSIIIWVVSRVAWVQARLLTFLVWRFAQNSIYSLVSRQARIQEFSSRGSTFPKILITTPPKKKGGGEKTRGEVMVVLSFCRSMVKLTFQTISYLQV